MNTTFSYNPYFQPMFFGKVSRIAHNGDNATFTYGEDGQRIKMLKKINTIKYYSENYEEKNGVGYDYIYTPAGLSAIAVNGELYFTVADHLGSLAAVVNMNGDVVQQLSYDAWGRRRHPLNWRSTYLDDSRYTPMFDRGYTGHEHLDEFDIINMNGRLYTKSVYN